MRSGPCRTQPPKFLSMSSPVLGEVLENRREHSVKKATGGSSCTVPEGLLIKKTIFFFSWEFHISTPPPGFLLLPRGQKQVSLFLWDSSGSSKRMLEGLRVHACSQKSHYAPSQMDLSTPNICNFPQLFPKKRFRIGLVNAN